jgi:hypothetical protein
MIRALGKLAGDGAGKPQNQFRIPRVKEQLLNLFYEVAREGDG